jgi:nitroreductase
MLKPIADRRSIRKYLDKPVDDATVLDLIESARVAPSGSNTQPWHFIIIRDEAVKRAVAQASHDQKWMLTAPVFIACVADVRARVDAGVPLAIDEQSPQNDVKQIIRDTAIATEHIVLEATAAGLGTCWIAWFVQEEIRPLLGLSSDKYLVSILTLGYPSEQPAPRKRKAMTEIIHRDTW